MNKPMPDWMKRMPAERRDGIVTDGNSVGKIYSELEQALLKATHTRKLTEPQRDKLDRDVIVYMPTEDNSVEPVSFQSPNELFDENKLFKEFANKKIIAMAGHGAPNGRIVDTLAHYEAPQGWLAYQKMYKVVDKKEDMPKTTDSSNSGYSPSIKRVEED
jgi:hypothetical protein